MVAVETLASLETLASVETMDTVYMCHIAAEHKCGAQTNMMNGRGKGRGRTGRGRNYTGITECKYWQHWNTVGMMGKTFCPYNGTSGS